ncbi:unnamed protein product [Blepharisma stoltei]|uniref:EF-hand domain-containing protein n=1 Tax=Blepharisma stoltei TaxID=1481888 RepID=A0AAU9IHA0_9CILI|nr:unnamed protein product [Blepharisma stoltei]
MEDLNLKKPPKIQVLNTEVPEISQPVCKIRKLTDIAEDPLEVMDDDEIPYMTSRKSRLHNKTQLIGKHYNPLISPRDSLTLPPIDKTLLFYQKFLLGLLKHPEIYRQFKEQAIKQDILAKINTPINTCRMSFNLKEPNRLKNIEVHSVNAYKKLHESDKKNNVLDMILKTPQAKQDNDKSQISLKSIKHSRRGSASRASSNSRRSSTRRIKIYKCQLDKTSKELYEIFLKISKTQENSHRDQRVTSEALKEWLLKRYPQEMVEVMAKAIVIEGNQNFDSWSSIIEKFINSNDTKILKFCFELFDFNKDKYICTHDAYYAISLDCSNLYDQDIVRIRESMVSKQSKKGHNQKMPKTHIRRHSTASSGDEEAKRVPYIHPTKPEALTVEDFLKISFIGKPQIFQDIISYLTGYNINSSLLKPESSCHTRRLSQDIVYDIRCQEELKDSYKSDPRYQYYLDLDEMMHKFDLAESEMVLEKFEMLKCPSFRKEKMISLKSTIEVWPTIFGFKCDYVSKLFYGILAGKNRTDITKMSFLKKINEIFKGSSVDQNKFAFDLYDRNMDGILTCDEINDMYESLPQNTPIYDECQILVNEFLSSIFGKRHKPLDNIDFALFSELIPKSLFIDEFIGALMTPKTELPRKCISFLEKIPENPNKIINI